MAGESRVTRSTQVNGGGVTAGGVSQEVLVDNIQTFKKTIPIGTNVQLVRPEVTLANVKAMSICATQDSTVKTNSSSSPQETLTLKANVVMSWLTGDPSANKFLAGDVTDWYVTNAVAMTLTIIIGEDSTPSLSDG